MIDGVASSGKAWDDLRCSATRLASISAISASKRAREFIVPACSAAGAPGTQFIWKALSRIVSRTGAGEAVRGGETVCGEMALAGGGSGKWYLGMVVGPSGDDRSWSGGLTGEC